MNRSLTGRIASYHFAPTELNRRNLASEIITENVFVTGNTVIDAFQTTIDSNYQFHNDQIRNLDYKANRIILVTAHRRENLGEPLKNICRAIKRLAENMKDVKVVYPVHLNPAVRESVYEILGNHDNVILTEPIDVLDMNNLMYRSYMVMTDSGGLQEEAPACGKPVLVMRTETERPEAVEAGTVKVVGTEEDAIYNAAMQLLQDKNEYRRMAKAINPYGEFVNRSNFLQSQFTLSFSH